MSFTPVKIDDLIIGEEVRIRTAVLAFDQNGITFKGSMRPNPPRQLNILNQLQLEAELGSNIEIPDSIGITTVIDDAFTLSKSFNIGLNSILSLLASTPTNDLSFTGTTPLFKNTNPLNNISSLTLNNLLLSGSGTNPIFDIVGANFNLVRFNDVIFSNFGSIGTIDLGAVIMTSSQFANVMQGLVLKNTVDSIIDSVAILQFIPLGITAISFIAGVSPLNISINNLRGLNLPAGDSLLFLDPNSPAGTRYVIDNSSVAGGGDFFQQGVDITINSVADNGSGKARFTTATAFIASIIDADGVGGTFTDPRGITTDSADRIIVADTSNDRIQIFDNNGVFIASIIDADGVGGTFTDPFGVTTDSADRILVADTVNNRIQIFDSAGVFLFSITDADGVGGTFSVPSGITTDSTDRIIVADTGNNRIQIFDNNGVFIASITDADGVGGTFNLPRRVTTDSADRILVADTGNNRIQIFDSNGVFIASIIDADGVGGTFSVPRGITTDSTDRIIVADTGNNRIQIFTSGVHNLVIGRPTVLSGFAESTYNRTVIVTAVDTPLTGTTFDVEDITFNATDTGNVNNASLDQESPIVISNNNSPISNSHSHAEARSGTILTVDGTGGGDFPVVDLTPVPGDWIQDPNTEEFTINESTGLTTYNGIKTNTFLIVYQLTAEPTTGPDQIINFDFHINGEQQTKSLIQVNTANSIVGNYIGGLFILSPNDTIQLFKNNTTNNNNTNISVSTVLITLT